MNIYGKVVGKADLSKPVCAASDKTDEDISSNQDLSEGEKIDEGPVGIEEFAKTTPVKPKADP